MLLLLLLGLAGCHQEGWSEEKTERQIQKRCQELVRMYRELYASAEKREPENRWERPLLAQSSIDTIEDRLLGEGLPVLDSDEVVPAYLPTGADFLSFLEAVRQGRDASQEVLSIRASGDLGYQLFSFENGRLVVYSAVVPLEEGVEPVFEVHPVLDWELTDRGNFYYSIYPRWDKHYVAYSLLRLEAPEKALWELTRSYIEAGGYVGSNLFLTDWTEEDFGKLCFNDLWEYLYRYEHGTQFSPEGYRYCTRGRYFEIPGEEFEEIILPYFGIDQTTLRRLAGFDRERNAYPWHQIQSEEVVSILQYYTMEPEVTAYRENADGTISMTVQVLSTDLKTDCLFSHEVTVLPLENGGFHFVGNRMISQGEKGIPYCENRLSW